MSAGPTFGKKFDPCNYKSCHVMAISLKGTKIPYMILTFVLAKERKQDLLAKTSFLNY